MQRTRQEALTREIFGYIDAETTAQAPDSYANDVTTYTNPAQTAREVERLFMGRPLNLALSCDIPSAGDCVVMEHLPVPVLLTRDRDGQVQAFMNICRHRGAQIVPGRCSGRKTLVCPYHAWTYDLKGKLVGVPFREGFDDCSLDEMGLRRLPVEERDGLIWVVPNAEATLDLDVALGSQLQEDIAAYELGKYSHFGTEQMTIGMNWKLVVDTFLESYHISYLHKPSIHPIIQSNRATFEALGDNLVTIYPRWTFSEQPRDKPEAWDFIRHTVMVYVLFPNTVFIMQGDHVEMFRVYPEKGSPDRSVMDISLYTPEPVESDSARRHWQRNLDLLVRVVGEEDFPLGETIQRGFHSGAQNAIVFGRNEPALAYYHQTVRRTLGLPPSGRMPAEAAE